MARSRIFMPMHKIFILIVFLFFLSLAVYYGNGFLILFENKTPSQSHGTYSKGSLLNGKRLPSRDTNFRAYSYLGTLLGRNSVHSTIRSVILNAYSMMLSKFPDKTFVYGEAGWPEGGKFYPHKTHQNGLSVDFMVPILDRNNKSVPLPASVFNKFGYGIEFDNNGIFKEYRIDFEAMAAHLYYLNSCALRNGIDIRMVIFDPKLQPYLFRTEYGKELKKLRFSSRPSWVRHDEHYHVDFEIRPASWNKELKKF